VPCDARTVSARRPEPSALADEADRPRRAVGRDEPKLTRRWVQESNL
jgi:hypothetical protein